MIHRISTSIFHASLGAFLAEGGAIITSFTPECQAVRRFPCVLSGL